MSICLVCKKKERAVNCRNNGGVFFHLITKKIWRIGRMNKGRDVGLVLIPNQLIYVGKVIGKCNNISFNPHAWPSFSKRLFFFNSKKLFIATNILDVYGDACSSSICLG